MLALLGRRTDWLRGLARRLVADAHVAEEAALVALEGGGAVRRPGPGWLAGVVRNVAAGMRRAAARRARHAIVTVGCEQWTPRSRRGDRDRRAPFAQYWNSVTSA